MSEKAYTNAQPLITEFQVVAYENGEMHHVVACTNDEVQANDLMVSLNNNDDLHRFKYKVRRIEHGR